MTCWVFNCFSIESTFSFDSKVVLMMDFQTLVSQRGHGVRAMAKSLVPITGSGQASKHFYDSMIFLFTNAYDAFGKVEVERIIKIAKAQFEEQKKQFSQRYRSVNPQAIADDPSSLKTMPSSTSWRRSQKQPVECTCASQTHHKSQTVSAWPCRRWFTSPKESAKRCSRRLRPHDQQVICRLVESWSKDTNFQQFGYFQK